jgi:imidazolonepropionase-like amidohydrolase
MTLGLVRLLLALVMFSLTATGTSGNANQLATTAPGSMAFTNVNVIDGTGAPVRTGMTVVVQGNRVDAVGPTGAVTIPDNVKVVDARGKYLIPGLWDMHVHWYDERLLGLFIANGVTGVRQMWGMPMHFDWRSRITNGSLTGPRFEIASPIVDGPHPIWPGSLAVSDTAGAREVIRDIKRTRYDFVKVYNLLPRDTYFALASEARRNGLAMAGHVPDAVSAREASDAGQKSIEHLDGILYATSTAEDELRRRRVEIAERQTSNGTDPSTHAALRSLRERLLDTYDDEKAAGLFARFVKNSTWQSPTLTVLRSMASLDDSTFTNDVRLKYMPRAIRELWNPANDSRTAGKSPADYALDRRLLQKQLTVVGAMHRAGVRILAATDTLNPFVFPGFSLHDELELLVEAGLSPMQALQAATINPAQYLGTRGTVETGNVADLVLLDANPLDDIRATRRISAVVAGGRLFERSSLDAILTNAEKLAALRPVSDVLMETIDKDGLAAALKLYRDRRSADTPEYDFGETVFSGLNALGYALLGRKKIDEAIGVFRLNVEVRPASTAAYEGLGVVCHKRRPRRRDSQLPTRGGTRCAEPDRRADAP